MEGNSSEALAHVWPRLAVRMRRWPGQRRAQVNLPVGNDALAGRCPGNSNRGIARPTTFLPVATCFAARLCPSHRRGRAVFRRTASVLILPICLFAALSCQPALAEPSGVRRASYSQEAASPAVKTNHDARSEPKPPARTPDGSQSARPLPPRNATRETSDDKPLKRELKPAASMATGMASLGIVLGLFLVAAWAVRRGMPTASSKLPNEVVEVLGRTPLAGRQFAHLIRCGNKILLVYLAPGCAETLTEITDPVEVDRLAGLCRQAHPQSSTASFRQVFQQFSREKK